MVSLTEKNGKTRVLMVDDEEDLLEQAKLFLKKEDEKMEIETTKTPKKALEILNNNNFDCVVSDYQMPEVDGLKLLRKIREENGSDIPFIMFTGKGREEVAIKALNLGADRYLQKGGNPKSQYGVLAQAINQEIKHYKAEEDLLESEERYRRLFESAQDGMIILNAKTGKIKDANPYIQELLGYSKEEIVGKELWEIGTFKDIAENKEKFEELVEEDFIRYEDMPLKTKSGEEASVEFVSNTYMAGGEKVVQCNIRDITERKKAEEDLEESERKFRKTFEASPDPVFLLDEDGVFVDVNKTALKTLGFEKKEIIGTSIWDAPFFLDETVDKVTEKFERRRKGKKISPYPVELVTKNGQKIIAEVNAKKFEENGFGGEIVIARDITRQKKKEKELQRERKRFFEIFNNANDAIYMHELDENGMPGNFIEVNDVACEMLGYTRKELLEMSPKDIDSSKNAEEVPEVMDELLEEGEVLFETMHEAKDGTEIPVEIHSRLFELEGKEKVLSIARDITEKKKTEKNLRKLSKAVDQSPSIITITDKEANIEYVNPKFEEVTGYKEEEVIGENPRILKSGEQSQEFYEELWNTITTGNTWKGTMKNEKKNGNYFWEEASIAPIKNEEDQITHFVKVAEDITKQKKLQEQLKRSQKITKTGSWEFDLETEELIWSDQTYKIFQQSKDKKITYKKFLEFVHPEDREYVEKKVNEGLETGEYDIEHRINVNGGTKWVREKADIEFNEEGEPERAIGIVKDITDRKRIEQSLEDLEESKETLRKGMEKYRQLTEAVPDAILFVDKKTGEIKDANKEAEELLGVDRAEIIGDDLSSFRPPGEEERYNELFEGEKTGKFYELNVLTATGEKVPVEIGTSNFKLRGQETVLGVFRNISGRRKSEDRREFLHSLLRHDVRNKIQITQGYHELLEEQTSSERVDKYVQKAKESIKESMNIIEKVTQLRKAQEEEIKSVEIVPILKETIEQERNLAEEKGIEIE